MTVYLAPLLNRKSAVRPEDPLGSLQIHPAFSRLALVARVKVADQFLDGGESANSTFSFIALSLENAADLVRREGLFIGRRAKKGPQEWIFKNALDCGEFALREPINQFVDFRLRHRHGPPP